MEQQTGSKLGKEYDKAVYCHSKEPLDECERGAKGDLKLNVIKQNKIKQNGDHGICSHNFMANKRWKKVETVADFLFWGSKITVDGDGSHKI